MLYRHRQFSLYAENKNVNRDMLENAHYFDFSDYPDTHSCFANISSDKIKCIKSKTKNALAV